MKKLLLLSVLSTICVTSFAGLPEMMKIYNNPSSAPKIPACKNDKNCNGFIALSKQWKSIPDSYRYKGQFNIKADAKRGITWDDQGRNVGLQRGFYFNRDQTNALIEGIDKLNNTSKINIEGGLAVLLYIEDKNGWAKD
ncbi:hypothetical protein PYR74_18420 [Acinetobacter bereziniae]|uniref:hypothetical protein n=2 Tax=Acinetobacter bereziniae TaxID=106648 RepID=UPI001580075E|nr:hypothetical protein [Acinetobacter bereziniae]MBJ9907158.1 hypothetical protein [Acinetobacter bereziniae]MBJ9928891.1 hypothetical protein [Acinetobacter bereziniae]NUF65426.1 hypothetical protein [Acinetobacter bereziniae]NUG09560.1 hypothetical protein [Acinetobacter bereziniae]NUG66003.1 hypothetical protein [Acinetobacter bereziniae]